jgi:hypothetical protein
MKQARLFRTPEPAKPLAKQRDAYDRRNLETAREILDNPEAHGGTDAFPSIWARLCIVRLEPATERAEAA